jgi:molecular chaperone DnaK (HSP70)
MVTSRGILNVSAKDKVTAKDQSMTFASLSGLSNKINEMFIVID